MHTSHGSLKLYLSNADFLDILTSTSETEIGEIIKRLGGYDFSNVHQLNRLRRRTRKDRKEELRKEYRFDTHSTLYGLEGKLIEVADLVESSSRSAYQSLIEFEPMSKARIHRFTLNYAPKVTEIIAALGREQQNVALITQQYGVYQVLDPSYCGRS